MIAVGIEEMHGSDRIPDLKRLRASLGLVRQTFNESEMARSSECTGECAPKALDTADIVRDAIFAKSAPPRSRGLNCPCNN
jgi:hypothetical protein